MHRKYRLSLLIFICLLFSGCSLFPSSNNTEEYEVIGEAQLQHTIPYEFTGTLSELYPQTTDIVLATAKSIENNTLTFVVSQCFYGDISVGETLTASFDENKVGLPILNSSYILFLNRPQQEEVTLLFDSSGWLHVKKDSIYPSSKTTNNSSGSLQQAKQSLERIKSEILMPPRFYYYRSLEDLALYSDYVFVGKLISTHDLGIKKFFLRSSGVEETFSDNAMEIIFQPTNILKGDDKLQIGKNFSVLLSPVMLSCTIEASNLDPIVMNYSRDTLDELTAVFNKDEDYYIEDYFVFANLAAQNSEFDAFFTNPVQGFVGIIRSDTQDMTIPISFNAPFVHSMDESEVIEDIEFYLSGEHVSVSYYEETFSVHGSSISSSPTTSSS